MEMPRKYNVELIKKNRSHYYKVTSLEGEELGVFPGVTGTLDVIAKPALINWASREALNHCEKALMSRVGKKCLITDTWVREVIEEARKRPDELKDEAADIGTRAHGVIDSIISGAVVDIKSLEEDIRIPVSNYLEWIKDCGIKMIMGDTPVASLKYQYGGSLDAVGCNKQGQFVLIDHKTSNGIYDSMALQVAAYAVGFEETFGDVISEALIARFDKKKPIFEHKKVADIAFSFSTFINAMDLKDRLKEEHFVEEENGKAN